jgi:adenylate cyclase
MSAALSLSQLAQHERALEELRSALHLNPSFALGRMVYGWALTRAGQFDAAVIESGRAVRMSPLDSFSGFYTSIHGLTLLGAGRFEEALPYLRASVASFVNFSGHYNSLISCCGHLGLMEEAQGFIVARQRLGPPLSLSVLRQHIPAKFANREILLEGMRKAGVPE